MQPQGKVGVVALAEGWSLPRSERERHLRSHLGSALWFSDDRSAHRWHLAFLLLMTPSLLKLFEKRSLSHGGGWALGIPGSLLRGFFWLSALCNVHISVSQVRILCLAFRVFIIQTLHPFSQSSIIFFLLQQQEDAHSGHVESNLSPLQAFSTHGFCLSLSNLWLTLKCGFQKILPQSPLWSWPPLFSASRAHTKLNFAVLLCCVILYTSMVT